MSHIHIPDGILPVWLVILSYLIIGTFLLYLSFYLKKLGKTKKIPLVGVISALMLITMTVEIIPPAYHMNLAVLSGIILGPVLSITAILVANIILAILGHGGVSVIGLNVLVVSLEAIIGFWGYKILSRKFKNVIAITFTTAIIALFISAWASIGVVYLGTNDLGQVSCRHEHSQDTKIQHSDEEHVLPATEEHSEHIDEHINEDSDNNMEFDPGKFITLVLTLGLLGWAIEAFVTAFIVNYINQVKPEVFEHIIKPDSQLSLK